MEDDYTFTDVDSNNMSDEENDPLENWGECSDIPSFVSMDDHDED